MKKLTQKDKLLLVPLIIFSLMTFMFVGINWAKYDERNKEIEFCPYIEVYSEEELLIGEHYNNENKGDEGLNKTNKERFVDDNKTIKRFPDVGKTINKHYEDLDVVDKTADIVNEVAEPTDMRAWVLSEVEKNGINPAEADCVISKESSWNPKAYGENSNGSNDAGIFQINSVHKLSLAERYDYKASTIYAIKLYKQRGWKPWYGARKCGL